jgi:hypothetical protein
VGVVASWALTVGASAREKARKSRRVRERFMHIVIGTTLGVLADCTGD